MIVATAAHLMREIAEDQYIGLEVNAAKAVKPRLPRGLYDFEDLLAEMRLYAVEAAQIYNPIAEAKFSTFLHKHLVIRSFQLFNYSWMRSHQPKGSWINTFTDLKNNEDEDCDLTSITDENLPKLETLEFLASLSPESRDTYYTLLSYLDDKLIKLLRSPYYKSEITTLTGVSSVQLMQLKEEASRDFLRYVGT